MAISPRECIEYVTAADKALFAKYEDEIDKKLIGSYQGQGSFTIHFYSLINHRVQKMLIEAYVKAGWSSVEFTTRPSQDPRDRDPEVQMVLRH